MEGSAGELCPPTLVYLQPCNEFRLYLAVPYGVHAPRTFGRRHPELKSSSAMLTSFVVSVSTTLVYETDASSRLCPGGQEMSLGGGLTVSDAVTCPFLPELNAPDALTGPATVVLFWALGLAPPRLTQT